MNITSDKENKLLGRREINFNIVQEGSTPSKKDIRVEICKKLNLDPETVIIVKVDQSTGVRQGIGVAHAYKSKEQIAKQEPSHLVDRMNGVKGTKVKKEKKAEAKKEGKEKK